MTIFVSIIIPVRNGEATIARCLEAALASHYENFEVIIVDDGSDDRSAAIIKTFPCTLIQLPKPSGASRARNIGASHSKGDILFFTDADCLLKEDTLALAVDRLSSAGRNHVVGGTYTLHPADDGFFSAFQSAFINHSESRCGESTDYIATHAMALHACTFKASRGFAEKYLPILEDVDFSHRLRRTGHRLVMDDRIQVRHLFNYSLLGSIRNGFKKAKYWTIYSIHNKDLLADSGTASRAFKLNVVALFGSVLAALLVLISGNAWFAVIIAVLTVLNISVNREQVRVFFQARRRAFGFVVYYLLIYPLAVGAGGLAGILNYHRYARLLEAAG
ncbi:MAG: glycosyltransferase [bacterium]|nr:glycosyltransferase [bacterium]